jgi:PTS system glucitol/sorbitol-specific IIA component
LTTPADGPPVGVRYESTVTAVGAMVPGFVESGILVLFASRAPAELHDICVLHQPIEVHSAPRVGDVIEIGSRRLDVLAVGDAVAANLMELGHASLKADGRREPKLPGDICVAPGSLPLPAVGDVIRVVSR